MTTKDIDTAYSWDDAAQIEENQYNLMPAGTVVDFTVEKIDKKRNERLNCPQMQITLKCTNPDCGTTFITETIPLHSKMQRFINAFFCALGFLGSDKTFGQLVNEAIGKTGRAKLKQDSYESKHKNADGSVNIIYTNKIDKYLKPAEQPAANAAAADTEDNPF